MTADDPNKPDEPDEPDKLDGEFDDPNFDPETYTLPKGKAFRLSGPQLFRIGTLALMLVAIIYLARPCADGVANFVDSFGGPPDAGAATVPTLTPSNKQQPGQLKRLKDMSDSEFRQLVGAPDGSVVPRPVDAGR